MIPEILLLAGAAAGLLPVPGLAGQMLAYLGLGILPGLAAAALLLPRGSRGVRGTVALALSPLVSTVLAWFLVRAGLSFRGAALAVVAAGAAGVLATLRAPRHGAAPAAERVPHGVLLWAAGLALVLVLVPVINPYLFIRGDSWIHGGIVMELTEHGFPPEDARMAGLKLNYVWFFNFFIALLHALHGQDLFRFMTLFNAANGFATIALTGLVARRLWRDDRAALAAVVVLTLGLNAGAFLTWPVGLVRAFGGDVRGVPEMLRQWHAIEWNTARIIYSLAAPFAEMVSFFDKLLVGTALNFAYLQMVLWMWALLAWLDGGGKPFLVLVAAGSAGQVLFHSVVGLSVLPLGILVLGLAWLVRPRWGWLPRRGLLAAGALATLAGLVLTLPYLRSITAGWAPERAGFRFEFLTFNRAMPWTFATACGFAIAWSIAPVRESLRAGRALPVLLAAWAVAMMLFALVIRLPQHNEVKFVYECFTACAALCAPRALEIARSHRARPRFATAVLAVLWLTPTVLTLRGYLIDRTGLTREELHPVRGEETVYRWLRERTPKQAVVVDRNFRDLVAVTAARRLYLGTDQPPELAAFPAPEMKRRQEAMRDLYGPLTEPDSTLARLTDLGRPVYVLFRPNDPPAIPEPWNRLAAASPRAQIVYAEDGFHVVRISPGGAS